MTLILDDLTQVSPVEYSASLALLTRMLQDAYPAADMAKRGPLHDLCLMPNAALHAANQADLAAVQASSSILAVSQNPALADDLTTLRNLASNFNIVPVVAARASGTISLIFSSSTALILSAGMRFSASNGQTFTTAQTYSVRTSTPLSASDLQLISRGDGTWSCTVAVNADIAGTAGNIPYQTILTPAFIPANFLRASAASDFVGGVDQETATSLLQRISTSWTVHSLATAPSLQGLIQSQPGWEYAAVSVVGVNDAEMIRAHSALPMTIPGRTDVWVRPAGLYSTATLTKTALLTGTLGNYGRWAITLLRDDIPALYQIRLVAPVNNLAVPCSIQFTTRGYDLSTGDTPRTTNLPDLTTTLEATYSCYQTVTLQFLDTNTPLTGLVVGHSQQDYLLSAYCVAGISDLQDLVCNRDYRVLAGDCLIRAAVPCLVTLALTVTYPAGGTLPSSNLLAAAAAVAINATGISNTLSGSAISAACHVVLPVNAVITHLSLSGQLLAPDGSTPTFTGTTGLTVTASPDELISARTMAFYCNPANVSVTLLAQ